MSLEITNNLIDVNPVHGAPEGYFQLADTDSVTRGHPCITI